VRLKQAGALHPHLSREFRAIIPRRLDSLFKYDVVAVELTVTRCSSTPSHRRCNPRILTRSA
jgi:hypothetical protein